MIGSLGDLASVLAQSGGVRGAVLGPVGVPVSFVLGAVSFFSPCVLPLVPGYISYMSGLSGAELEGGARRGRLLAATLLFVLGFAIVFTALGASASAVGGFLFEHKRVVDKAAGGVVILMGIAFLSGLFIRGFSRLAATRGPLQVLGSVGLRVARIFSHERTLGVRPGRGLAGALPLGAAFAVGWTPCIGPTLGTILTLSASEGSVGRGATLLFVFSLGFGIWFVLGGLAFRRATRAFKRLRRLLPVFSAAGGTLLVTIGVLLVTDQWARLMTPIQRYFVRFSI
ncbi:MAG: sulfite exporter TauE/SafE family protein [Acidobacteria bacterium]|nr:sulfite exporter TauE/SafE family protein [Acidobacteriota bacterium]